MKNLFCILFHFAFVLVNHEVKAGLKVQGVQCNFSLIIPQGCLIDDVDPVSNKTVRIPVHLTVLHFNFVENPQLNSNQDNRELNGEKEFCEFTELLEFPINCLKQNTSIRFKDHVSCPRADTVVVNGPALWTDSTEFPLYGVPYIEDTTGLFMNCVSTELLQLRTDEKTQYSGIGVKLGKTPSQINVPAEPKSENLHWLQMQIPKNLESGILQGYSGNYTLYSQNEDKKEIIAKSYQIIIEDVDTQYITGASNFSHRVSIDVSETEVICEASTNENIYLASIGGENHLETRLLSKCLSITSSCEFKRVGMPCWKNRPCSILKRRIMAPHGVLFCSHPTDGNITQEYFTALDGLPYTSDPHEYKLRDKLIQLQLDDHRTSNEIESGYVDVHNGENSTEPNDDNSNLEVSSLHFFEKQVQVFECHYVPYILVPSVQWKVRFRNQTVVTVHSSGFGSKDTQDEVLKRAFSNFKATVVIKSSKFSLTFSKDMEELSCSSSYWDSSDFISSSLKINVTAGESPKFSEHSKFTSIKVYGGQDFSLTCGVQSGSPHPIYEWKHNNKKIVGNENCIQILNGHDDSFASNGSRLSICNAGTYHQGNFTCRAINFLGWDESTVFVRVKPASFTAWVYFTVACAIIAILGPLTFALYRIYLAQKAELSAIEIEEFVKGDAKKVRRLCFAHENAKFLPYNKDYEVDWKDFKQAENEMLGEGAYGIVLKGKINDSLVAAKTVRPNAEKSVVLALLSELKIMIYMGKHDNIVGLVGACTSMLKQGRPYVFVEYCCNGDFHTLLKNCRSIFVNQWEGEDLVVKTKSQGNFNEYADHSIDEGSVLTTENKDITLEIVESSKLNNDQLQLEATEGTESKSSKRLIFTVDLLKWAADIACGMDYLENKKVIHGDLAARNVLVTASYGVKISDFGLSRQLQPNYAQYVKTQRAALPWRWMAIESLSEMVFTSKSDVWAYGITLWEIFTLAQTPFPGFSWSFEFMEELKSSNLRPPKPQYANEQIYQILRNCWNADPENRPSFAELQHTFAQLCPHYVDTSGNYVSC